MAFYQWLLKRKLFLNLFTGLIILIGVLMLQKAQREAYPTVDFGTITISSIYPGSSPEEMETFVTDEVEDAIKSVEGIKETESVSTEGRSYVVVTLLSGEDTDKRFDEVQRAVDRIDTFPSDMDKPVLEKMSSTSFPVISIAISSSKPYPALRAAARALSDQIDQIPGVARVDKSGYYTKELRVSVLPDLLKRAYLSIDDVVTTVQNRSLNVPGGALKQPDNEQLVRSIGEVKTKKELEQLIIQANDMNHETRVKDIGIVEETFEEPSTLESTNGKRSIVLTIIKKESGDIIKVVDEVQQIVSKFKELAIAKDIQFTFTNDISERIHTRLSTLYNNAGIGIFIVATCLFLFLNFRISTLVALGIPMSILAAIPFLSPLGISINLVSVLGFILVIGMIVDNAIVVSENIYRHYEQGKTRFDAAVVGTSEVVLPIIGASLTTFAAFLPLLFMGGTMGKFVWSIPVVVMITIAASLVYALFVIPNWLSSILKAHKEGEKVIHRSAWFDSVIKNYETIIRSVLKKRYILVTGFMIALVGTLILAGTSMKFVLFPTEDAEIFTIKLEGKSGLSLEKNEEHVRKIEDIIAQLPKSELETFRTSVGLLQNSDTDIKRGGNYAQISVEIVPESERERKARDIIESLRKDIFKLDLPYNRVQFEPLRNGPPVGKAVQVSISGKNYQTIQNISAIIKSHLSTLKGTKDISSDFIPGKEEFQVKIREKEARSAKINMFQIANTVRSLFSGVVISEIKDGDEKIELRVIGSIESREDPETLSKIQIKNKSGALINLNQVTSFEKKKGYSDIFHFNRKRTITVFSDLDNKQTNSVEINRAVQEFINTKLKPKHPDISFSLRGENEDTNQSMKNLGVAFIVSLLLIYIIIAGLFNNIFDPFLIMLAIPFGIVGVLIAFFMHGQPISFMMIMGVIGLNGVVVNNTIILVSVINDLKSSNSSVIEAVIQGAKQRLRAVLLTSITTLLGLFPTAYGLGGADPFIKPMCLALAWGILGSTILTLFLLPCTYMIFTDLRRLFQKILKK